MQTLASRCMALGMLLQAVLPASTDTSNVQKCNDSTVSKETEMHRAGGHSHALLLDERLSIDLKRSRDDILVMRAVWSARAANCICTA